MWNARPLRGGGGVTGKGAGHCLALGGMKRICQSQNGVYTSEQPPMPPVFFSASPCRISPQFDQLFEPA